jgi:hypothetical protein
MPKAKFKDPIPAVPPARLNMWVFMVSSSMLFAATVSAFIVHRPDAQSRQAWTAFDLPIFFLILNNNCCVKLGNHVLRAKKCQIR